MNIFMYRLIESVFPDLDFYTHDPYNLIHRCSLAPKNSSVDELNEMMIRKFPGNRQTYISSDKTVDQRHQSDYEDFRNSQNPKGLPPHKLLLKKNCPIMLLRNLNPAEGLCNGTRLICRDLAQHKFLPRLFLAITEEKQFLFQGYLFSHLTTTRMGFHSCERSSLSAFVSP